MKNIFDELSSKEELNKTKEAAQRAQKLRKTTEINLDDSRLNENEIKLNFNKEKLLLKNNKNKEQSGGLKTFYLHSSHIKKLNQWNKQGYSNSKIIQMLIDNAPEKF